MQRALARLRPRVASLRRAPSLLHCSTTLLRHRSSGASTTLLHSASPPSLRLPLLHCSTTQLRHRSTASEDDSSTSEDDSWVNGAPQALVDLDPAREARFREIYDEIARGKLISNEDLRVGLEAAVPGSTVTSEQVDRMMEIADVDGSGKVDFSEFVFLFGDMPVEEISMSSLAQYWLGFSDTIADPKVIFSTVWRKMVLTYGDEMHVRLPEEIMFLGGAPGAGKGTMTPYIMGERGLTAKSITLSSLLNSPTAQKVINEGGLVSDLEVFAMLLQELTRPEQRRGALVDGFPRTVVQVQLLQHLHAKMRELSRRYDATPLSRYFPRPRFRMCILYVDEHESIQRQLSRGRLALEHNKAAAESGEALVEVRPTDLSVAAAKQRYRLFVEGTMEANEVLQQSFPYNLINASGSIDEVKQVVIHELSYQSSLELGEDTYNAIKHIPTAAEITTHARQNLVSRLDGYQTDHAKTFADVIAVIEGEFLPAINRHALVGEARVITRHPEVFTEELAMDMAVDVMYDRGFRVRVEENRSFIDKRSSFHFKITFTPPTLHNAAEHS